MKKCCTERHRHGPVTRVVEVYGGCTTCILAYDADMAILEMREGKTIKAFERMQNIRKSVRELPDEA